MNGSGGEPASVAAPAATVESDAGDRATFWAGLSVIALVGLGVRLWWVLSAKWNRPLWGDAWFYHWQARLLSEGHGFVNPAYWYWGHLRAESADHPPLFTLLLTGLDSVGLKSVHAQLIVMCLLGAAAVVVVGLAGRKIGGARLGLIGAALAAIYPNLWLNDGMLMSETVYILLIALAVLWAYRYWRDPTLLNASVLSVVIALATLTRVEAILMFALVVLPLVVIANRHRVGVHPIRTLAVCAGIAVLFFGPWIGFNLSRFDKPMLFSADGITLRTGNCQTTYSGYLYAYYDLGCVGGIGVARSAPQAQRTINAPRQDQSVINQEQRQQAIDFMKDHAGKVPFVVAGRLGRVFNVYRVDQTMTLDQKVEDRGRPVWWGLWMYYALVPFAIGGGIVLWRRRTTVIPLVMLVAIAAFATTTALGVMRYRVGAEVGIVLLAAAAIDAIIGRWYPGPEPAAAEPDPALVTPAPDDVPAPQPTG